MAFNLKKVLKALLLSTSQPLSIKEIQAAFTRFHEQGAELIEEDGEESPAVPAGDTPPEAPHAASEADAVPAAPKGMPALAAGDLAAPTADVSPTAETSAAAPVAVPAAEPAEVPIETAQDPELYRDVPALITATQIRDAMNEIAAELRAKDEGILLIEGNAGYRIVTHPRFARWVRILRQEPPPVKLTQSAIETLAVISYRQPVTRGEIETIRGVSAEAGINKLLERELIYIVGRADAPGRPIQYGTTDQFLEFVGIKSLDELPASDVLSSRQIDEWLKNSTNSHTPTDTDMGLADEQLPLEAAAGAGGEPAVESGAPVEAAPAEVPGEANKG
jgi:segregation and condensation protein B